MKTTSLCFLLFLGLLASACDDPNGTGSHSGIPNSITGKVILMNTDDNTPFSDHSGVTVKLQGTSFSATSNAKGEYTLSNIPPGNYVITYTKPGFDSATVSTKYSGVGVHFLDDVRLFSDPTVHSIRGLVQLENVDTDALFPDHSGATVTVLGTGISATTTVEGHYHLDNVPAGEYRIRFEKVGFTPVEGSIAYDGIGIHNFGTTVLRSHTQAFITLDPLTIIRAGDLIGSKFADSVRSDTVFISGKPFPPTMLLMVATGVTHLLPHNQLDFAAWDSLGIPHTSGNVRAVHSEGERYTFFLKADYMAVYRDHGMTEGSTMTFFHGKLTSNRQTIPPID